MKTNRFVTIVLLQLSLAQKSSSWSDLLVDPEEQEDEVVVMIDARFSDEEDEEEEVLAAMEEMGDSEESPTEMTGDSRTQTALRWCCASALNLPESDLPRLWKMAASDIANGACRPREHFLRLKRGIQRNEKSFDEFIG